MKCVTKHPMPLVGTHSVLTLAPGAVVLGAGIDNGQTVLYVESQAWGGSGYIYWEVQVMREGESYSDALQVLGMMDDPEYPANSGHKLFVVGRING